MILTNGGSMDLKQMALPLLMVGAFIVFYYFLFIRPQSKKRKETQGMLDSLRKGDRIVTIGGIHGKVVSSKDNEITIRVDSNAEITFDRNAISKVISGNKPVQSDAKGKDSK
jgi:preprotein translocase subunit YajC